MRCSYVGASQSQVGLPCQKQSSEQKMVEIADRYPSVSAIENMI